MGWYIQLCVEPRWVTQTGRSTLWVVPCATIDTIEDVNIVIGINLKAPLVWVECSFINRSIRPRRSRRTVRRRTPSILQDIGVRIRRGPWWACGPSVFYVRNVFDSIRVDTNRWTWHSIKVRWTWWIITSLDSGYGPWWRGGWTRRITGCMLEILRTITLVGNVDSTVWR